jgi:nucleoside-diphosphate-sugar epimerase
MLVDDGGIETLAAMPLARRLWWAQRYTHMIHVDDVAVGLERILFDPAFAAEERAGRLQVFNFSADADDDHFLDLFAALGRPVGLPRPLVPLMAAADRLKDAAKFRNPGLGWPYGAVAFAPDKLRAAGIAPRSLRRRILEQGR